MYFLREVGIINKSIIEEYYIKNEVWKIYLNTVKVNTDEVDNQAYVDILKEKEFFL